MDTIVSACLAGESCRYDGGHCLNAAVAALLEQGKALPVCPEVLGGLPVPREACEIRKSGDGPLTVVSRSGRDVSAAFYEGAERTLMLAERYHARRAILKAFSPSCGFGAVYDGTFQGHLVMGNGISAGLLCARGLKIYTEQALPPELA